MILVNRLNSEWAKNILLTEWVFLTASGHAHAQVQGKE